jgi:ribosome-binding factor A
VAKRLGLKFAPKLTFRGDESFDEAERIERLLNDPKVTRDLGEEE